jgi:hypothetical protein
MATSGAEMRAALIAVLARLRSADGSVGLPRVWNC